MLNKSVLLFLLFNIILYQVECAKILVVFPFPGRSQFICGQQYFKELAARGHEVTVVSGYPQKKPIKNYRDVPVLEMHDGYEAIIKDFVKPRSLLEGLSMESEHFINFQTTVLNNPGVQKLLKTETFDVVIMEQLQTELLAGLGPHFNASMIAVNSLGVIPMTDDLVGNTSPVSYLVNPFVELESLDTIWDRFVNLKQTVISKLYHHYVHLHRQRQLFKKYFPEVKSDIAEVRKNFSLVLVNNHYALNGARPLVPNMLEVGGFFITEKPIPLPAHMEKFINESEHGVIYFSMGTNVKSSNFPVSLRETIMKTFAGLKERVLWKFELPDLPGKPDNVLISPWFPQTDILRHPKVKMFITHCGQLSSLEALYHGKPVIGVPAIYDQFMNAKKLKKLNMGLIDTFDGMTVEKFTRLIRTVLDDSQYALSAKKHSAIYHDQPMTALEKSIYWTEYVIRHQGAPQLKVAAQKLSFIEYFDIDIFLIILTLLIASTITIISFIKFILGQFYTRQHKNNASNKSLQQKKKKRN